MRAALQSRNPGDPKCDEECKRRKPPINGARRLSKPDKCRKPEE